MVVLCYLFNLADGSPRSSPLTISEDQVLIFSILLPLMKTGFIVPVRYLNAATLVGPSILNHVSNRCWSPLPGCALRLTGIQADQNCCSPPQRKHLSPFKHSQSATRRQHSHRVGAESAREERNLSAGRSRIHLDVFVFPP